MQRPPLTIPLLSSLLCSSLLCTSMLLLPASVSAQSIKITLPDTTTCTYATGQVTSNATPGQLQATSSGTPIGTGCGNGSSAVTFGPASPLSPSAPTLSSSTGTVNFGFQALNASQCTGSITGASGGAFTNGTVLCNSSAACSANVSAPASFTNSGTVSATYNVAVTCTASGSTAASNATVTVPPAGTVTAGCTNPPTITSTTTGIANFTQITGTQSVYYFGAGYKTVDLTSFDSIYWLPWPGNSTLTADISLPTNKYVAAQFKVPNGYIAGYTGTGTLYGDYAIAQSGVSASISMTISKSCGDFSNPSSYPTTSTVVPGCWKNKLGAGSFLQWRAGSTCILHDNATYFLNIINADMSAVQPAGGGSAASTKNGLCSAACSDPVANDSGTWTSYTFPP